MQRFAYVLRNGIILFLLLGLYFLLLDALGWANNIYLRLVNFIFIFFILRNTIKRAVKKGENYPIKFLLGLVTVGIGITLSVIVLYYFLYAFQPDIERYANTVMAAHSYFGLCLALLIESWASSIILLFIMLQFYKNHQSGDVKVG